MIYTLTLNPGIDREYTVPDLTLDTVLRTTNIRQDPGGKGFNVSRMLKKVGLPNTALGLVGGQAGSILKEALEYAGIRTDFIQVRGESRTNISIIDQTSRQFVKVNEPGPEVSREEIEAMMDKIRGCLKAGDWWVLSGSLPPGVPEDIYARIICMVNESAAFSVLDADGEPLRLGCMAGPYLVKPNSLEAGGITGMPADTFEDLSQIAAVLLKLGAKTIVISAGKKGALMKAGKSQWVVHPPRIRKGNPVGAGDAMLAGMVWKLVQNEKPETVLRWGVACGAASASLPGTEMPSLELINQFFLKTKLKVFEV